MSRTRVSFADMLTNVNSESPLKAALTNSIHASTQFDLEDHRKDLLRLMNNKGHVLPYDLFFSTFLYEEHVQNAGVNPFSHLSANVPTVESPMYIDLPTALNDANICPGFTFVAHPHKPDSADESKQAVDCGLYIDADAPPTGPGPFARMDWSQLEIPIECKTDTVGQDPFVDQPDMAPEKTVQSRMKVYSQLLTYAQNVFKFQQRTFFYMILFLGNDARILRFDRSSVFVTEKFNYKTESWMLVDFLTRYAMLNDEHRGHDPTAIRIYPDSPLHKMMKDAVDDTKSIKAPDYVRDLFKKSLDEQWPWWQLEVPDRKKNKMRKYLVGRPHFQAPGVACRGTRGYVALPVDVSVSKKRSRKKSGKKNKSKKFVYLKDAWRVNHEGIKQEGLVLEELKAGNVPHIPTLVCHGDLPGIAQETDWASLWAGMQDARDEEDCPLKRHHHYRVVVEEVGRPLEDFGESSVTLIFAIYCCLKAHQKAYKLGILHRDISAGNIILVQDKNLVWHGVLNDWELSKRVEVAPHAKRQPDRTGTWQFMSVNALNDAERHIVLQDDLESFFHVLLYIAVRFLESNLRPEDVGCFLADYFDGYGTHSSGFRCGRMKSSTMYLGEIQITVYNGIKDQEDATLRFAYPKEARIGELAPTGAIHPINHIIGTLLTWFKALYAKRRPPIRPLPINLGAKSDTTRTLHKILGAMSSSDVESGSESDNDSSDSGSESDSDDSNRSKSRPSTPHSFDSIGRRTNEADGQHHHREDLSENLKSHSAMLKLFSDTLHQRKKGYYLWPEVDRVPDMKPAGGVVRKNLNVPSASRKRSSNGDHCSASKRSKPNE